MRRKIYKKKHIRLHSIYFFINKYIEGIHVILFLFLSKKHDT